MYMETEFDVPLKLIYGITFGPKGKLQKCSPGSVVRIIWVSSSACTVQAQAENFHHAMIASRSKNS